MWCRNGFNYLFEKRLEIIRFVTESFFRNTVAGDRIKYREFDLLIVCAEVDKKIVNLVDDFLWPRVLSIDLVDYYDRLQVEFELGKARLATRGIPFASNSQIETP